RWRSRPMEKSVRQRSRQTYTPAEIRHLLDRCEEPSPEAHALVTARLSEGERLVVGRYLEQLARQYERLADAVERGHPR
ncbi:MAG: hypothetical protein ACRDN8_21275, partial [Thermoleophilaceae bacterium]